MKVKKTAILLMVLLMVWAVLPPQGTAVAAEPAKTNPAAVSDETLPITGENFGAYLWSLSLLPVVVGELLFALRKKRSSKQKS
ncbi:MAG: hypothetical protein GX900_03830 [Clostridiaceae bacterium]|nr:hypothetical protein [Clostridiaceae bacterium]